MEDRKALMIILGLGLGAVVLFFVLPTLVGIIYTSNQDLIDEEPGPGDEILDEMEAQSNLNILVAQRDSDDTLEVQVSNLGDNSIDTEGVSFRTEEGESISCLENLGTFEPEETHECSTGIDFPTPAEPETIIIEYGDGQADSYQCAPPVADAQTC